MLRNTPVTTKERYLLLATCVWALALPWLLFPEQFPWLTASMTLLLLGVRLGARRWQGRFFPATPLDSFILLYMTFAAISQLFSPAPEPGLPKLFVLIQGMIGYYLAYEWLANAARQEKFTLVLSGALVGIALVGLFTLEWPARQIINLRFITDRLPHLSGAFTVHFNEMAGIIVLLLPFLLATVWRYRRARWRQSAPACLAMILVGSVLLLTQSRAALISLAAAALAFHVWARWPLRYILPVIGAAVLLPGALFLTTSTGHTWLVSLDEISKAGTLNPTSWLVRLEIWRNAAHMLRDYPLFGAGLYAFEPVSRANYPYGLLGPGFNLTHAHNLWLQTGATLGWPALAAMVGLWVTPAYYLWQQGRQQTWARLYGASLTGYLVFNAFDLVGLMQKPGLFVWLTLAGSAALILPATMNGRLFRWWRWLPLFVFLLALPLLPRNLAHNALDQARLAGAPLSPTFTPAQLGTDARRQGLLAYLRGDTAAAQRFWQTDPEAALFLQNQGQLAAFAGNFDQAVVWYDLAIAADPTAVLAYYWRGVAYEFLQNQEQAALNYELAVRHLPQEHLLPSWQTQVYYKWAQVSAAAQNYQVALSAIRAAMQLEPDNAYYYLLLGDILQGMGDVAGANQAYEQAERLR